MTVDIPLPGKWECYEHGRDGSYQRFGDPSRNVAEITLVEFKVSRFQVQRGNDAPMWFDSIQKAETHALGMMYESSRSDE